MTGKELLDDFVRNKRRMMCAWAMRCGVTATDADDCVQEALLRAYRTIDRYNPSLPMANWLHRYVTNECLRHRKKQQILVHLDAIESIAGHASCIERLIDDDEIRDRYQQALMLLSCLDPKQQRMFLNVKEGRTSLADEANEADVTINAMTVRVCRLQKRLRAVAAN